MSRFTETLTEAARARGEDMFPTEDWKYDVDNGDTTRSLAQWREALVEQYVYEAEADVEELMRLSLRFFNGDLDPIRIPQQVLSLYGSLRIDDQASEACDRAHVMLGSSSELLHAPRDMVLDESFVRDLDRLSHLAMVATEGRADHAMIATHISEMAQRHGIENEIVASLDDDRPDEPEV